MRRRGDRDRPHLLREVDRRGGDGLLRTRRSGRRSRDPYLPGPDRGLGGPADPVEPTDRLDRVPTDRALLAEHDRIRPVEHGIGHVGRLGPGRARVRHHAHQHLGRHDDRFARRVRASDEVLLRQREPLERHLDPEVAAGHHDRIRRG